VGWVGGWPSDDCSTRHQESTRLKVSFLISFSLPPRPAHSLPPPPSVALFQSPPHPVPPPHAIPSQRAGSTRSLTPGLSPSPPQTLPTPGPAPPAQPLPHSSRTITVVHPPFPLSPSPLSPSCYLAPLTLYIHKTSHFLYPELIPPPVVHFKIPDEGGEVGGSRKGVEMMAKEWWRGERNQEGRGEEGGGKIRQKAGDGRVGGGSRGGGEGEGERGSKREG